MAQRYCGIILPVSACRSRNITRPPPTYVAAEHSVHSLSESFTPDLKRSRMIDTKIWHEKVANKEG